MGAAERRGGEARIGEEVGALDGGDEPRPVAILGGEIEQEPAAVRAAVEIREPARRLFARRARLDPRARQGRLHLDAFHQRPLAMSEVDTRPPSPVRARQ